MNDEQETIGDIMAEMRNGTIPKHRTDHELLTLYADRIDAALQRVASKMSALQRELWNGKKMGEFAFALALDGFASALSTTAPAKGGAK